ncbi:MAG: ribosome rescue GTPase HflX [Pseudomonadota bacterium]
MKDSHKATTEGVKRAIVVHITFKKNPELRDKAEFLLLAKAAEVQTVTVLEGSRETPDPSTFIGSGKLEELQQLVEAEAADVILFNHELSPAQERNLDQVLKKPVLSRTALILEIFALRAQTHEGKLQVALAKLRHLSTRLVRRWSHLERQKGGIGLRGGMGETQLEIDRRLIRQQVIGIEEELAKVASRRDLARRSRERNELPTVALVGYTNAGKSSLFNRLTGAEVFVADQLFATLDPTIRTITLKGIGKLALIDTVGFIRHLPHTLVNAFKATLEETRLADLLLHVVDYSSSDYAETCTHVQDVLTEIGADQVPQLMVYNKIDALSETPPEVVRDEAGHVKAVYISALKGSGLDALHNAIANFLQKEWVVGSVTLGPEFGEVHAALHQARAVEQEHVLEENGAWAMQIRAPMRTWQTLCAQHPECLAQFVPTVSHQ